MKRRVQMLRMVYLLLMFVFPFSVFAQETISGKVTDAADGSSIPGATVLIKGTTSGTTTGIDGTYSLKVKSGQTLAFSFVGYETLEVIVSDQKVINVQLKSKSTSLNEVVVIGYGAVKKSDATGSVTSVSAKDFNRGSITTPQELLMGKTAGVVISNPTGAPGSAATIRIRGGSSLNASNDPLIVVDGVPIDNGTVSGNSNFLSFINPNDIETFTVLKDASATAIYGSRASNGVIIITTKKGTKGKTSINYNGSVSLSVPTAFLDVYSGDEIRNIAFEHKDLFGASSFEKLGSTNTNWQKEIFRTAVSTDHNLSVMGAVLSLPYRVSVGYTNQQGILKNTDMNRITGALNLNPTFLNNSLKVNLNAKGMHTNNNYGSDGAVGNAINMDPSQVIKDGNEVSAGYFQWNNYGSNLGTPNPVEQAMEADNKSVVNRFIGNIEFNYTFPFLKDLGAVLNLATDYTKSDGHNNRPVTSPSTLTAPYVNGRFNDYSAEATNKLLDFYFKYNKSLSEIKSKIEATAGYSYQKFTYENYSYTYQLIDEAHPYQKPTDSASHFDPNLVLVSFFGRLNYTFADNYLLTFTLRDDGSSRFNADNRWGLFPSAAFAWKIKDAFLPDAKNLSDLKLRLGWGKTGQQDIGGRLPYMPLYNVSSPGSYYYIDGQYIPTLRPAAYDPKIKWEETTTINAGVDFGFMDGKISGSFDIYKRTTEDLLNSVEIPTGSNFSNRLYTNVGTLENKGCELTLNAIPVSTKDQTLNLSLNLTYNVNKITQLTFSDDESYKILYGDAFTGIKQVTMVGYAGYSFFVNKQVYDSDGNPIEGLYEDLSGKGGVVNGDNDDKYIYHNPTPDYLMGFSARYNYKGFDASLSARGSIGNYVYNAVAAGASYDQMYQIGYWHNEPKYLDDTKFVKRQFTSDYFVENASFLKIDNATVGYNFGYDKNKTYRLSFTVQNALTFTKYSGIDPEVNGGIDNNFYPRPRTFMVGFSLGL